MAEVCDKKSRNPNKIVDLPEEYYKYLRDIDPNDNIKRVQVGPKKYMLREDYKTNGDKFYDFKVRADDIWVVTLPRSGTTLMQEMVWQIKYFNLNTESLLIERFPFLDIATDRINVKNILEIHKDNPEKCKEIKRIYGDDPWKKIENNPSPRFIKTHRPLSLLPPELLSSGCKVIYVARNPKDMMVSRFRFTQSGFVNQTSFESYYNLFENDLAELCPIWAHIQEGWERRNDKNFLFMFYEDMVLDMKTTIEKVSKFLDVELTGDQITQLAEHLKVENFKNNTRVNRDHFDYLFKDFKEVKFVRSGKVGAWNELFTEELNKRANTWIEENYKKTDLRFPNMK